MRKVLATGLVIVPFLAATAVAQQSGVNPQEKAQAEKLTQAPGGSQTSLPQPAPPATPTQATTSTQQAPAVRQMNQEGAARLEKEGK
jgi:hypothetical protein